MLRTFLGFRANGDRPGEQTSDASQTTSEDSSLPDPRKRSIANVVKTLVRKGKLSEGGFRTAMLAANESVDHIEWILSDRELVQFIASFTASISQRATAEPDLAHELSEQLAAALLHKDDPHSWHELALKLKLKKETALAFLSFQRSVAITPSFFNLWHLSLLSMESGEAQEALELMNRAVGLVLPSHARGPAAERQAFFAPLVAVSKGDWPACLALNDTEARALCDKQQGWIKDQFISFLSGGMKWWAAQDNHEAANCVVAALVVSDLYGLASKVDFSRFKHINSLSLTEHSSEVKVKLLGVLTRHPAGECAHSLMVEICRDPSMLSEKYLGEVCRLVTFSSDSLLLSQIAKEWNTANGVPATEPGFSAFSSKLFDLLGDNSSVQFEMARILGEADNSNARPEVTVVVPAYNAGRFLAATLESIKAQQLENFECIVVDDGSTDGSTGKIAAFFARSDRRFRVLRHIANSGLSAARNSGIRAAKADKICFLDADDLLMPESLSNRSKQMDLDWFPLLAGSYSGSLPIAEDVFSPPPVKPAELRAVSFVSSAGECPFNANQPMFYTNVMRQMGGFDEALNQAEDYDMWSRVLRAGYVIKPVQQADVTYRQRADSMIRSNPMHHLTTSMRIKDRANKRLDAGMIVPGSPAPHVRAHFETQRDIASVKRVFQFAGMALAQGRDIDQIAEDIDISLADCPTKVGKNAISAGLAGYKRQLPHAGPNSTWKENYVIGELYDLFSKLKRKDPLVSQSGLTPDASEAGRFIYPGSQGADILFLPHKDYHLQTIQTISDSFQEQGLSWGVVDFSCHYRDEGVRAKAKDCGIDLIGIANFMLGYFRPKAIVAFNDWDPIVRNIFAAARKAGVVTCSIVEGIQDYHDVDTGRRRGAYRSSEYVFLPGEFDKRYFKQTEQSVEVAGIPRVAELRKRMRTALPSKKVALINSNFSYGVLTDARDEWVRQAVEGAIEAGFEPVITRHPADLGEELPELVTDLNFYEAVEGASVVVNRFASGVLEAIAMGRPVVYLNPHGEKVDKFMDPMGVYPIANDQPSYVAALNGVLNNLDEHKQHWDAFLDLHTGRASKGASNVLTEALIKIVRSANPDAGILREELAKLDLESSSLTDLKKLRELGPHYGYAS